MMTEMGWLLARFPGRPRREHQSFESSCGSHTFNFKLSECATMKIILCKVKEAKQSCNLPSYVSLLSTLTYYKNDFMWKLLI